MTPFRELNVGRLTESQLQAIAARYGITAEQAAEHYDSTGEDRVFQNDVYQVIVRPAPAFMNHQNFAGLMWLSIRRRDGKPVRSWPDLQEIKNAFLGKQGEAIEVFPAESRKVDSVNQYHLFGAPHMRAPFGFPAQQKEIAA